MAEDDKPIPAGFPALLYAVAADPALLERIVAGRSRAAAEAGFTLVPNEQSVLDSLPAESLRMMAQQFSAAPTTPGQAEPRPLHAFPAPGGCAPDVPRPTVTSPSQGIRPGNALIGALEKLFKKP